MAGRRARLGTGSNLRELREASSGYAAREVVPPLAGLSYVVVGGLATRLYMPERATLDTDILVHRCDEEKAEQALRQAHCRKTGVLAIGGSTWSMPGGRSLDLLALDEAWVCEAITSAVRDEEGIPYIDLSYLVLMKLGAGRVQDLADVSRMLGCASTSRVEMVRDVVRQFRPQDSEDLESLAALGRLEHQVPEN